MPFMDSPETTDDAREEARANLIIRAGRVAAIVLACCLMYILSIGPVAGIIVWAGVSPHSAAGTPLIVFYTPVNYLHDQTPLKEPLEQYTAWWERMGERFR
jgi:hypothetical protein